MGDPVVTRCGCRHREYYMSSTAACFNAGPSLRKGNQKQSKTFKMELIEAWVGSGGPTCLFTPASPERTAVELSTLKSTQKMRGNFHMCRHLMVGGWGCVQEMVCAVRRSHNLF